MSINSFPEIEMNQILPVFYQMNHSNSFDIIVKSLPLFFDKNEKYILSGLTGDDFDEPSSVFAY